MKDKPLVVGSRRRCDNDGRLYTVKTENHHFCRSKCRNEFNRFGSPFLRLRARIASEVEAASDAIESRMFSVLDAGGQARYRRMYPARARRFDELLNDQQQAAS